MKQTKRESAKKEPPACVCVCVTTAHHHHWKPITTQRELWIERNGISECSKQTYIWLVLCVFCLLSWQNCHQSSLSVCLSVINLKHFAIIILWWRIRLWWWWLWMTAINHYLLFFIIYVFRLFVGNLNYYYYSRIFQPLKTSQRLFASSQRHFLSSSWDRWM